MIVAAVSDPRIDLLASGRSTPPGVRRGRRRTGTATIDGDIARRLRHRGIDVADALPEDLAPAWLIISAMKSTGALDSPRRDDVRRVLDVTGLAQAHSFRPKWMT